MMKRNLLPTVALCLALTLPQAVVAQDLASQLIGVWKLTSFVTKELATGETITPYGERPSGQYIFTRGGHFAWIHVADGRKAAAAPAATEAERIALYETMGFGSGTYRVEGTTVSYRYDTSSMQSWTGSERTAQPQISGKVLTNTSQYKPISGKFAGKDVISTITYEREE
jgi:hypothetical protein